MNSCFRHTFAFRVCSSLPIWCKSTAAPWAPNTCPQQSAHSKHVVSRLLSDATPTVAFSLSYVAFAGERLAYLLWNKATARLCCLYRDTGSNQDRAQFLALYGFGEPFFAPLVLHSSSLIIVELGFWWITFCSIDFLFNKFWAIYYWSMDFCSRPRHGTVNLQVAGHFTKYHHDLCANLRQFLQAHSLHITFCPHFLCQFWMTVKTRTPSSASRLALA